MFFRKKVDEINVNATDNEYLVWKICFDGVKFDKTVRLNVGTGCQALIYVNGVPSGAPREAGAHELNMKKALKNNDKIEIVGVRRDAQFSIKFALIGENAVPYIDSEVQSQLQPRVSIRGECYCKVLDGAKIYTAYGCRDGISAEDVRKNIFGGITQILIDSLGKKLNEYSYFTIAQSLNDLSDTVKRLIEAQILNEGFLLERCSVELPYFGENYAALRAQAIENAKKEERRQDERDRAMRIVEKSVAAAKSDAKPASKSGQCPKCGKKNAVDAKFCRFCGSKMN